MKRKVIQLAHSTAVISLPSKWVKKYGVKKGDEIEVGEEESRLIVTAEQTGSPKKQEIEVDFLLLFFLTFYLNKNKKLLII